MRRMEGGGVGSKWEGEGKKVNQQHRSIEMPLSAEENDRDVCTGEKRTWVHRRDFQMEALCPIGSNSITFSSGACVCVCRLHAFDETTQAKPRLHLGFLPPEVRSFYSAD